MAVSLDITGTLGRFGYHNIPLDIRNQIVEICTAVAFDTAKKNAPYDQNDPPVHIKDELTKEIETLGDSDKVGYVYVRLPYAGLAEYGAKGRLPHPYMRPAGNAARRKMKAIMRSAAKKSVADEKKSSGAR